MDLSNYQEWVRYFYKKRGWYDCSEPYKLDLLGVEKSTPFFIALCR